MFQFVLLRSHSGKVHLKNLGSIPCSGSSVISPFPLEAEIIPVLQTRPKADLLLYLKLPHSCKNSSCVLTVVSTQVSSAKTLILICPILFLSSPIQYLPIGYLFPVFLQIIFIICGTVGLLGYSILQEKVFSLPFAFLASLPAMPKANKDSFND